MESKSQPSLTTGHPAANTAETLRALQERAQSALAAQRARMGQLEAQLTDQLDSISATIAEQLTSQSGNELLADQSLSEIAALRQALDDANAACAREREQFATEAASRAQLLEKQRAEIESRAEELTSSRRDLESRQQALDDRATQLNARERELRRIQEELDGRAQESARQQSQLAIVENGFKERETDLAARESADQAARQQLAREQAELEWREQSWQSERAAMEAERTHLSDRLETLTNESLAQGGELAAQLGDARRELAAQQIAWENEHARAENERLAMRKELDSVVLERDALAAKLATLIDQSQATTVELASQLADAQQQLELQRAAWDADRSQLEAERLAIHRERDELAAALAAAGEQLATSQGHSEAATERDELQQKFDLVLADMQRLRGRTAELEQELASRPAPDQKESSELVHLRGERDALAHRVAELERQPATVVDVDTTQQIADLQRRFELAVEDVRDLKKQNRQMEAQLAAAKSTAPPVASSTGGNWEAVKKQLLASLEGETGDVAPARLKEIASIENTVRITDEVVSNKDRQIAELKLQLAGGEGAISETARADEGLNAIIDADAVIQKHRERIAQIEQEMEDKLRATELQLSMERAKIAREQAQLTELRIELESMRGPNGTAGDSGGNAPKRRWLSKLGLGDEDKK